MRSPFLLKWLFCLLPALSNHLALGPADGGAVAEVWTCSSHCGICTRGGSSRSSKVVCVSINNPPDARTLPGAGPAPGVGWPVRRSSVVVVPVRRRPSVRPRPSPSVVVCRRPSSPSGRPPPPLWDGENIAHDVPSPLARAHAHQSGPGRHLELGIVHVVIHVCKSPS